MQRRIIRALLLIISFSLFDALIHGGIAAAMQRSGSYNQAVSDMYQLGFALAMAAVLALVLFGLRWRRETAATVVLLFGLVEDTLYFVFMPVVNPLIKILAHGAVYRVSGGGLFPPSISGWLGWLTRAAGYGNMSLPMASVLIINAAAIAAGAAIIVINKRRGYS